MEVHKHNLNIKLHGDFSDGEQNLIQDFVDSTLLFEPIEEAKILIEEFTRNREFSMNMDFSEVNNTTFNCYK